jgi:hypothetical protein
MKSIQAMLQSRISKRSAEITCLEYARKTAILFEDYQYLRDVNDDLKELRENQVLDKRVISSVYWGVF